MTCRSLLCFVLSVMIFLGSPVWAGEPFHPQDLSPDFFAESVQTFVNPLTNSHCFASEQPNYCCTGVGTGTCDDPVSSFRLVHCTTRRTDCTGFGVPHACCTGNNTGNCCYDDPDPSEIGLGIAYCPSSVCPDGCVNQWLDQSGYKSQVASHPITGRTLEQDDLEKPCYKENCINGHPCLVGHPKWDEPSYPEEDRPKQDATLEIEGADRTGPLQSCSGAFYLAQLVKIIPQSQDHRLLAGFTKRLLDDNVLQFRPFSGGTVASVNNVFPILDAWYLIELQRNNDMTLRVWIDGVNRTRVPAPTNATSTAWATNSFCVAKTCDAFDDQEFQGEAALLFYKCGGLPTLVEKEAFRAYVLETFTQAVFADGFEDGDVQTWSRALP